MEMTKLRLFSIYLFSIVLLSFFGQSDSHENILNDQEKLDLIHQYKLHEKTPLAEHIRLTNLNTDTDLCFNVRSSNLLPNHLIQIPCSTIEQKFRDNAVAAPTSDYTMSEQSNATKNETVNIIENDIYMKLHYKTDGTKNSIFSDVVTLQQVAENVFYQNVDMIHDIESLELWTSNQMASTKVDFIQLVDIKIGSVLCIPILLQIDENHIHMDTNEGYSGSCEDYLRRNNRRKREDTNDETTIGIDINDDWGLSIILGNDSNSTDDNEASFMSGFASHTNKIRGHVHGGNGGSPFDDSSVFPNDDSIISDFTPSEYHVTYCENYGLSIQFTYQATVQSGSTISKQAPRHGSEHTCVSHTILLHGNAITKVVIVSSTFGADGQPRIPAISGIQFFTNGWQSPFYGSKSGSVTTEMSSSHVLGYLTGHDGYLIDRLQLVWIRPQQYSRTPPATGSPTTTQATDTCAVQCVNPGGGRTCIPKVWLCDGDRDCADGSDEDPKYCANTCEDQKIKCASDTSGTTCIYKTWMCDGDRDCADGSDEDSKYCDSNRNIKTTTATTTTTTRTIVTTTTATAVDMCGIQCLKPGDGRKCIPKRWMCDGEKDCADGSDEDPNYCGITCEAEKIGCINPAGGTTCIYKSWMCDNDRDCADGSDEDPKYCDPTRGITSTTTVSTTTATTASSNASVVPCGVRCLKPGNGKQCIPKAWLCDGDRDCDDGSDEDPKYCAAGCDTGHVRCLQPGSGRTCFDKGWMCDGDRDCADGSDEDPKYCDVSIKVVPVVCGRYQCLNGGVCNQAQQICNCPDGYTGLDCSMECGNPRIKPRYRRLAANAVNNDTSEALVQIINGTPAVPHSWPWMVWMIVGGSSCGGMLIDDQHVLTAAHCTEQPDLNQYRIFVGTVEYGGEVNGHRVTPHTVSKRYQHSSYNRGAIRNDISILKLSKRVPITDKTGYVCLPREQSNDVKLGETVIVTGWGRTNPDRHAAVTVPDRLMQAEIEILAPSKCPYRDYNEHEQICAGGTPLTRTGICSGDSGGPLIQMVNGKWVLFGITSYSHRDQCAHPSYADGFTRVKFYRNWINEQLKSS